MCGQVSRPSDSAASARAEYRRVQPLGPADHEAERARQAEPAFQQGGERLAVRCLAGEVQRHHEGVRWQGGQQRLGLAALDLGGRATALRNLGHGQFRAQAGVVAGEQIRLRPGAQPADGDQAHCL